jgi:tetratricopeptide (TPR) repeat protein
MPDSKRLEISSTAGRDGDRGAALAAEIESLLLDGLDRYFAHQYDDAIHVWTRVLFLDRTHPRARAYIDRARTALAERQRRGDELLQSCQDLLDRGAIDDARTALTAAVSHGADDARAAALWLKLERRERTRATASIAVEADRTAPAAATRWDGIRKLATAGLMVLGVVAAIALAVAVGRDLLSSQPPADVITSKTVAGPVVLSSADVALVRARNLYAHGRLAEALKALDRVPASDAHHAEADGLRREIQRLLLATAPSHARQSQGPTP